eukprot:1292459-Amphidinium_carterae.1
MKAVQLRPTHPDFLPVLYACSRCGLAFVLLSVDLPDRKMEDPKGEKRIENPAVYCSLRSKIPKKVFRSNRLSNASFAVCCVVPNLLLEDGHHGDWKLLKVLYVCFDPVSGSEVSYLPPCAQLWLRYTDENQASTPCAGMMGAKLSDLLPLFMQHISGILVFRLTSISTGFGLCGATVLRILAGNMEGDPAPWALVFVTMGCPSTLAGVLRALGCIDAKTELRIFTMAYYATITADSGYMAFSSELQTVDLWMKSALAPSAYVLWGCSLQFMSVSDKEASANTLLRPLFLLTTALIIRLSWDPAMTGMLSTTWVISLIFQGSLWMLHDMHSKVFRSREMLLVQRNVQESLLSAAFDATFQVERVADADRKAELQSCHGLVFA